LEADTVSTARLITPVILSGGSGTRLWPLSRRSRPKQMLALTGEETMLRLTVARVADRRRFGPPLVIAAANQADAIAEQLGKDVQLLLEPVARNTAPAVALAALAAASSDQLLLVMPSDHLISDPSAFIAAVESGIPAAERGMLVTFGVHPTRPETGYGYIRRGDQIGAGVYSAAGFVEKPDAARAAALVVDGGYDWNAGIFLFSAGAYLKALSDYAPDIAAATALAMEKASNGAPDAALFSVVRAESVDRAVMERASNVAVVPVEVGWSDVGSWDALYELGAKDADGNAVSGPVDCVAGSGNLIRSDGPRVVAVGVENLIIVATADGVLVVPRGTGQSVGEAVAAMAKRGDPAV
jgi:mannose-1-phosphate guanylyltransferase